MKIINREQLSMMPNGTVFATYKPDMITGDITVITGRFDNESGFNGTISLEPMWQWQGNPPVLLDEIITGWVTTDETDYDFDEDQLFVVFSKTEIKTMIEILMWALADCSYEDNIQNKFFLGDNEIPEKELEQWTDNTRGLTWG